MTKSLNKIFEGLIFTAFICFALILTVNASYSSAVLAGVKLWAAVVLPSLFPYFFITAVLSSLKITGALASKLSPLTTKVFNVGGHTAYALVMSVISGYPVGAKLVSDLSEKGLISGAEKTRAAALCSSSSPMFLIASVGTITFNSPLFGVCLFLCQILSVLAVGVIFSFYKRSERPSPAPALATADTDNILYEGIFSAVNSILFVGGLITLFYLFTEILLSLKLLTPAIFVLEKIFKDENLATGVALGVFECTKGLTAVSASGITRLTLPVCAMLCGFGGVSVICQSIAYLKKAKVKAVSFLLAKCLSAVFGFIFGLVFNLLLF